MLLERTNKDKGTNWKEKFVEGVEMRGILCGGEELCGGFVKQKNGLKKN